MIKAQDFVNSALKRGYNFWTGVPCSFIKPLINYVLQDPNLDYIGATSEGEAVGIAAGAYLAGRKTVVMCQNSGLGNTVNPLTSLNFPFRIPTMLIVTHRGALGLNDEPQHELMGQITGELLDVLRIPWEPFPQTISQIEAALQRADDYMCSNGLPYAFVMSKGSVEAYSLTGELSPNQYIGGDSPAGNFACLPDQRISRFSIIKAIKDNISGNETIVATTGKIGRELFSLGHRNNQIYMVGSMGCAAGIGLGICQATTQRKVVVLDGDGAVLMKMGTLATIGHYQPKGLVHIVLDNEVHESTGGQATVSSTTDLAGVASACGYKNVWRVDKIDTLNKIVKESINTEGPSFIHVKVALGSDPKLGRPNLTPIEVKEQFMMWLKNSN
ncbi:MAG: phosphonopyruvate decarboxylase [Syntrophomonadaceae bacterium]|nr:phosphonopyruvate decarboxylase [Syntrophomonadaceae bacterium]